MLMMMMMMITTDADDDADDDDCADDAPIERATRRQRPCHKQSKAQFKII